MSAYTNAGEPVVAGDLVLVPMRVTKVSPGGRVYLETEEPAEPPCWPLLVVNAGQKRRLRGAVRFRLAEGVEGDPADHPEVADAGVVALPREAA